MFVTLAVLIAQAGTGTGAQPPRPPVQPRQQENVRTKIALGISRVRMARGCLRIRLGM
jgi:hypothetical protein